MFQNSGATTADDAPTTGWDDILPEKVKAAIEKGKRLLGGRKKARPTTPGGG